MLQFGLGVYTERDMNCIAKEKYAVTSEFLKRHERKLGLGDTVVGNIKVMK